LKQQIYDRGTNGRIVAMLPLVLFLIALLLAIELRLMFWPRGSCDKTPASPHGS
jgi:hypothetical protein